MHPTIQNGQWGANTFAFENFVYLSAFDTVPISASSRMDCASSPWTKQQVVMSLPPCSHLMLRIVFPSPVIKDFTSKIMSIGNTAQNILILFGEKCILWFRVVLIHVILKLIIHKLWNSYFCNFSLQNCHIAW